MSEAGGVLERLITFPFKWWGQIAFALLLYLHNSSSCAAVGIWNDAFIIWSQCYWPIGTFWNLPGQSGSPGGCASLSGTWCNCLKVKTIWTVLWSFAVKHSMLFLHFWQKCDFSLQAKQLHCILSYVCSALSSSSLQSRCLLVCCFMLCPVVLSMIRPAVLSSRRSALHLCSWDIAHHYYREPAWMSTV